MLTRDRLRPPPHDQVTTGYQCRAHAYTVTQFIPLGTGLASSPRLALRWLRTRAHQLADQLDPPDARTVRLWLHHQPEHERALTLLRHGEPYTFTFHDDEATYTLTVQPEPGPRHTP